MPIYQCMCIMIVLDSGLTSQGQAPQRPLAANALQYMAMLRVVAQAV